MANAGEDFSVGSIVELNTVDADRLVGFGAAEYVKEEIQQKEEKQPEKVTKEDKTANKRKTK